VLEAPLDGDVLEELLDDGGGVAGVAGDVLLLEELDGALLGALSLPQAANANAAATASSSALFIQVPLLGCGEGWDSPLF
jgi:hypothetical protein